MVKICEEVIRPSKKLQKLNNFLKLIILLFISLFVFDYFYFKKAKAYFYLLLSIILIEIIVSKYYKFVKIFSFALVISLMNNLINLGLYLQNGFSIKKYDINLYYNLFTILLHFISLILSFEIYKETKAIYIEEYENSSNGSELSDDNNKE